MLRLERDGFAAANYKHGKWRFKWKFLLDPGERNRLGPMACAKTTKGRKSGRSSCFSWANGNTQGIGNWPARTLRSYAPMPPVPITPEAISFRMASKPRSSGRSSPTEETLCWRRGKRAAKENPSMRRPGNGQRQDLQGRRFQALARHQGRIEIRDASARYDVEEIQNL